MERKHFSASEQGCILGFSLYKNTSYLNLVCKPGCEHRALQAGVGIKCGDTGRWRAHSKRSAALVPGQHPWTGCTSGVCVRVLWPRRPGCTTLTQHTHMNMVQGGVLALWHLHTTPLGLLLCFPQVPPAGTEHWARSIPRRGTQSC